MLVELLQLYSAPERSTSLQLYSALEHFLSGINVPKSHIHRKFAVEKDGTTPHHTVISSTRRVVEVHLEHLECSPRVTSQPPRALLFVQKVRFRAEFSKKHM